VSSKNWIEWPDRKKFKTWKKAEKEATKLRKIGTGPGKICSVCGKGWYEHSSYGEILEHGVLARADGKQQWVKV
jgi:hypothetical protein